MEPYLRVRFAADRPLGAKAVVEAIRQEILSTAAPAGCRLPPIRVLAHQLGVSKNTVTAAYEELKAQDLVESRGRQGLFVSPAKPSHRLPASANTLKKAPAPLFKTPPRFIPLPPGRPGLTELSSVFIDLDLLPSEQLAVCFRSVVKGRLKSRFPDKLGYPPLREIIADRLRKRGIEAHPDHVITTIGSMQVPDLVCRSLARPVIATEDPAFYVAKALFEMSGIKPVGLPIEPFKRLDVDKWNAILKHEKPGLVYLTTNFQNPTGYSYSTQELKQILEWSHQYDFGILEDDWGSDMLSFSEFKPCLRALGGDNVIYMNSFTKKLLPSLRLGYVLGNEKTAPMLAFAKRVSISAVPAWNEAALFEFLDRGYYDAHLKRIQPELDMRYQNCLERLREKMPAAVRWTSPGGGPVLWLEVPRSVDLPDLAAKLRRDNVQIDLSENAFFGKPHLHGFKIGYAFLKIKEMNAAIDVLAHHLRALA